FFLGLQYHLLVNILLYVNRRTFSHVYCCPFSRNGCLTRRGGRWCAGSRSCSYSFRCVSQLHAGSSSFNVSPIAPRTTSPSSATASFDGVSRLVVTFRRTIIAPVAAAKTTRTGVCICDLPNASR